jgi:hypothetical protein
VANLCGHISCTRLLTLACLFKTPLFSLFATLEKWAPKLPFAAVITKVRLGPKADLRTRPAVRASREWSL